MSNDPLERVPPASLTGNPADCPASFTPVSGLNHNFVAHAQNRTFLLQLPPTTFTGPRPLFVAFHGTGETPSGFSSRASLSDFVARGFVVVAPASNANGTLWPVWDGMRFPQDRAQPNADLALFDTLVSCLATHIDIDQHRLYAGGHSAGGIFLNHLLQSRSSVLAGGIVGSGIFSYTEPLQPQPLETMVVLITWGGDNDEWSGTTSGVSTDTFRFVDAASLASIFYNAEPQVKQINCHANNRGHVWLSTANDWMIDLLLSRPKGYTDPITTLPPTPPGGSCSTDPFLVNQPSVTCAPTAVAGCQQTCQLIGDCVVVNDTASALLDDQLDYIGFTSLDCSTCVNNCAALASSPVDMQVVQCMATEPTDSCGPGLIGSDPFVRAFNRCCPGHMTAELCGLCSSMPVNSALRAFFTACN